MAKEIIPQEFLSWKRALALALQAEKPTPGDAGQRIAGQWASVSRKDARRSTACAGRRWIDCRRLSKAISASFVGIAAEVYALLARGLAEWGENEQAVQLARKGVELSEHTGLVTTEALCLSYLGRILASGNDWEQARRVFQRIENIGRNISPWYWYNSAIFALDSILDCETPPPDEVNRYVRRVQETGSDVPAISKARLLLRDGQPSQALVVLEQALSDLMGSHLSRASGCLRCAPWHITLRGMKNKPWRHCSRRWSWVNLKIGSPRSCVKARRWKSCSVWRMQRVCRHNSSSGCWQLLKPAASLSLEPAHATGGLIEPLSERELQVLQLLAQGGTDKQIAAALFITRQTVHSHLKNIYGKLDVHSRTEAIHRARQLELL